MKKLTHATILGQRGINLIEQIVLEMGFSWNPTNLDAGIDGYIEIRRPDTGEMTNNIIQVQSKATDQEFENDKGGTFEFRCDDNDLDYWMSGNAPVILVRSRPRTQEAYWISIKDYFSDPKARNGRKIVFNKSVNRLDSKSRDTIARLAIPEDSGSYLKAAPKHEVIHTNLLRLRAVPSRFFVGRTKYRTGGEVYAMLREVLIGAPPGEWLIDNKSITSFYDLTEFPWNEICDGGTVEDFPTRDWQVTDDEAERRRFAWLLNRCVESSLRPKDVIFSKAEGYYYFRATRDLSQRAYVYVSRQKATSRKVFKGYPGRNDPAQMYFYRHSAFFGRFVRFGQDWFLEICPTYHFTRDGFRRSRFSADLLSGIKRRENNNSVHGQVVMWASLLTERTLFDPKNVFLDLDSLVQFEIESGLDDEAWLRRDSDTPAQSNTGDDEE